MRSAVVVGAGLGGLAVAGALSGSGWQVTLLERADRVRPEPTAVVLWPNGVRALRALGLDAALAAISTPLPDGGVRRPDGQWLVQPRPASAERTPLVAHREDLYDALIAALGDRVDLRTGVTIRSVRAEPGERPVVGDGRQTFTADLVVAADGTDSVLRRQLAPATGVVSSGCVTWAAVVPWYQVPPAVADRPAGGEVLGAGYRFVSAPLGRHSSTGRGGVHWIATAAGAPRPEPPETQLTLLRRWYAGWPEPVAGLLAATDPAALVQREIRELRPLPRTYAFPAGPGGVVLLGDAAHAMPPHLGQGACLAFEDAATLQSLARELSLPDTLTAYDRARRSRAATVVRQTRRMSAVLQTRGRLALRARDAALGAVTPRLLGRAATVAERWRPPQ
ncbi:MULTISPECIES: FAD-dependent oxidoreductase [Micromonospora]|uniref:2-polyprenyl-6-methoxyphenol hydroxylase n=1 Tax=Micromonospora yangpuensis TaxID=683228 RepID=A0A1C6UZB4_9ACTN|nr:NAD(P)/FAD-dependent oxidoreductase [Micromonospora yangpuensis]GGL96091.1 monooxygenase [Micromonospora yangpuensis]SCL59376.1 2-polyprenyl-6-methoxyphenol hydroxylase [Micromonospora yangpuensis]